MRKSSIFVSWPGFSLTDAETGARLVSSGLDIVLAPKLGARSTDQLLQLIGDASGAIVSTDPFTRQVIEGCPALRVIARVGVGTDSIDMEAASRAGVAVSITPGMNSVPVAEQAVAMILGLLRKVAAQDVAVRAGRWERVGAMTPTELAGKTIGLIGAGSIARQLLKRLSGFDAEIIFFDQKVAELQGARRMGSVDELLAMSDIVSLHVPLTPATANLIDAAAIALMKPGALLINTSRGGIVDEQALFAALRSGWLGGAALDVFATEPPDPAVLADVPTLLCSAHMGGLSHESIARMTASATDSVIRVLSGEYPDTVINRNAMT